jgi:tetratricopeptide (TPR) repeat protein
LARSYAPVDVATRLLDQCAASGKASTATLHQLAGVLRDTARGGSPRATELYREILASSETALEQRLHTLCGLGENLGKARDFAGAHAAIAAARSLSASADQLARVDHRLAWLLRQEGRPAVAIAYSEAALARLDRPFTGGLASRILDTHAGILLELRRPREALEVLEAAILLKRRRADRRGLQISLMELSTARERLREGDALSPAQEGLRLAESAGDRQGQIYAHRRIANLFVVLDRTRSEWHRSIAKALSETGTPA